jgi:hypothetical protein
MNDQRNLLLEASVLPREQAFGKWKAWRAGIDLDNLDPDYLRLLPLLSHHLDEWLTGDSAKPFIQGICKRAWTQNQLALRRLATITAALRGAGVDRIVLTGSAAWALLYTKRRGIRPIDSLELLVARNEAGRAVDALTASGWRLAAGYPKPEGETLDYLEGVWLMNAREERLKLGWRLLPCAPELAASREKLAGLTPAEVQGIAVHLLPLEEMLLHALAGHREPYEVDWRWDALALIEARSMDWNRVKQLAADEIARRRLRELEELWGIPVPAHVLDPKTGWFRTRVAAVWRDYQWHAWRAGASPSWRGFALYCPRRWWKVFVTDRT